MLSVYGDESSDARKQRVFAVAGLIGSEEMWARLERAWNIRTDGVPFHANHCESNQGAYAHKPNAENKALYRDLTIFLANSGLGGWGFVIDLAAQRRVFPDAPDIVYYRCFIEVLEAMRNCAANNRETVRFTFDSRQESQHNAGMLYTMFQESPEWKDIIFPEISFVSSREQPRVQAADLFAREVMKVYDNRFGPNSRPVRKSWTALSETGRFHVDAVSTEWFEDLKRKMPELQKATGMLRDQYLAWLEEYRLVDNTSNQFRYMLRKERDSK